MDWQTISSFFTSFLANGENGYWPYVVWIAKLFSFVFLILLFSYIWRKLTLRIAKRLAITKSIWDDSLFHAVSRPIYFAIWFYGFWFIFKYLITITNIPNSWFVAVNVAFVCWILIRFISYTEQNLLIRCEEIKEKKEDDFSLFSDPTAIDAIGKLLRLSVVITTILIILQTMGVSINAVLAFGGVGGIAIGFAAKDLLANFFGGLFIYLDRPFAVGDWIRSPDREIEGTVEKIGWRQTCIRTFTSRPLYIPNALFNSLALENPSRMRNRRIFETIGIRYDDFAKINDIINDVTKYLEENPDIDQRRTLIVNFDKFDSSSLNFFIYCFTITTNWKLYHGVKHRVLVDIGNIILNHQAEIAYPTQTLHIPAMDNEVLRTR